MLAARQIQAPSRRLVWSQLPTPVAIALALHPVSLVAGLLTAWQLAIDQLGHRPVPYQHDPQFLDGPIGALHTAWMLLLMAAIPAVVVSALVLTPRRDQPQRWISAVPTIAWAVAAVVVWLNWDAFVWFID